MGGKVYMFGYSMVQMVRSNAHKLDWYSEKTYYSYINLSNGHLAFCTSFSKKGKNRKKMSVIIEFEEGCHESGFHSTGQVLSKENAAP